MKIFVTSIFERNARKESISDKDLYAIINRSDRGLIDAKLGLSLIKQRLPRQGQGRSGGFRTVIAYERGKLAVFLHMFAKNAKQNLTRTETEELRALAGHLMRLSDEALARLVSERGWRQIENEQSEEDISK